MYCVWDRICGEIQNKQCFIDIDVEEIDKQEVLNSERESIKSSIISLLITIKRPLIKIIQLLAVSSIDNVMQYYDLFKERSRRTRFALLFSPMAVMKIQTKQMIAFQMMNKNTIGRQNQRPPINQVTAEIN
jgi:hypothetical protein